LDDKNNLAPEPAGQEENGHKEIKEQFFSFLCDLLG